MKIKAQMTDLEVLILTTQQRFDYLKEEAAVRLTRAREELEQAEKNLANGHFYSDDVDGRRIYDVSKMFVELTTLNDMLNRLNSHNDRANLKKEDSE